MRTPVISLWSPWAWWVVLGYKPIETRTHQKFASLVGKRVAIHVTQYSDPHAIRAARPFAPCPLDVETPVPSVRGGIIGTAYVREHRKLTAADSRGALIDCGSVDRWGLFLEDVREVPVIRCGGKQGIWYAEVPA